MKPGRIFFLGILVLVFIAVPALSIQGAALFTVLLTVISFAYSKSSSRAIEVTRKEKIIRLHAHQEGTITFRAKNTGIIPHFFLYLHDNPGTLYVRDKTEWFCMLYPGEVREFSYQFKGLKRGAVSVGPVKIAGSDPLGFFPWKKEIREQGEVIVYPQVINLDLPVVQGLPAGQISIENPIYEDVTRYKSIREYSPGDDMRRINWKVSARHGQLYSMSFMPQIYFPSIILLNLCHNEYPIKKRYDFIERAIEVAAGLVFFCLQKEQEAALISTGITPEEEQTYIPLRGGYGHGVQILENLASIDVFKKNQSTVDLLLTYPGGLPWGTRIMYIGPALEEDEVKKFDFFMSQNIQVDLFYLCGNKKSPVLQAPGMKYIHTYHVTEHGDGRIKRI